MTSFNIPTKTELAKTFSPFLSGDKDTRLALPLGPESKRHKFERKYGMLYTGASVVAGGGVLYALHKGGGLFSITDFLKKSYLKLQVKAFKKLNEYKFFQRIRHATNIGISYIGQKTLEFANFVGNMNPFKDIAFDRFCQKIKIKPMFDKLTSFFTKSAKKLTMSKYTRAEKDLLLFQKCLREIAEQVKNTELWGVSTGRIQGSKLADDLIVLSQQISDELQKITGQNFTNRFDKTVSMLNSNSERKFLASFRRNSGVSLFRQIVDKIKECGDFLPKKIMEPDKKVLYQDLMASKKLISNSILDLYQTLSKSVDDVFYGVPFSNQKLSKSYLKIRDLLDEFKSPLLYDTKRAETRAQLISALEEAFVEFSPLPNAQAKQNVLRNLIDTVKTDRRGLVEESVHLCKVLKESNPALYERLLKARNEFQKSFNDAVNFETQKTYGKMLDFSLHSLPTDMVTISLGIGGAGYALHQHKKSKKERMKNNLEKGIPVLGGIAVSFLSNMRMVASGVGALFLGVISGIALNRIAKTANDFYWKHEREKNKKNIA